MKHIHTHTLGTTILDEGSARCMDLYLTHNTCDKHPYLGGIRTRNPSKRAAQTDALDSAATGIMTFSRPQILRLLSKTTLTPYSFVRKLRLVLTKAARSFTTLPHTNYSATV